MIRRILSINGNKSMNFLLQTVLSRSYQLTAVFDIYQAMHELKNNRPVHLIIVDIDGHEKENFDFIQHIKTSALYNIPVIVLTSELNDNIISKLIASNIYDYFEKPFSPTNLLKTVNELTLTPLS